MTQTGSKSSGFTLLEVIVAMIIMSGAIVAIANSWAGNIVRLDKARVNNSIVILLQEKMFELETKYKDKSVDEVDEELAGDFSERYGNKYQQYRWEMKSKEMPMPDLSGSLISREGGADELLLQMVRTIAEYIKQAVREMTVTVIYKKNAKSRELKNSITTYIVDYKKEIPLGPGGAGGGAAADPAAPPANPPAAGGP